MAFYGKYLVSTLEDMQSAFVQFFIEHPNTTWILDVQGLSGRRAKIAHKTEDMACAFDSRHEDVGRTYVRFICGTGMAGGWHGISNAVDFHGDDSRTIGSVPWNIRILATSSVFVIHLESVNDGASTMYAVGKTKGIGKGKIGQDGVFASGISADVNTGNNGYFLGGVNNAYPSPSSVYWRQKATTSWIKSGGASPVMRPPINGTYAGAVSRGCLDYNVISKMKFPLSATTVFIPLMFAEKTDGWYPMHEIPTMRVCASGFFASGDSVTYQGKTWYIFQAKIGGLMWAVMVD